jgi:hypothetical protein
MRKNEMPPALRADPGRAGASARASGRGEGAKPPAEGGARPPGWGARDQPPWRSDWRMLSEWLPMLSMLLSTSM